MYGSLHVSESITRLSVAGIVLWLSLSAALATVVGVAAWSAGHATGTRYSPAAVRRLQGQAYARGVAAGSERASRAGAGHVRVGVLRRKSYERGYAAGYRAGRAAGP
jgi:hypothetical protein